MEIKLCRTCGKFTEHVVNIFRTEGLKNKLETCLPIIVSPHCLLPDNICTDCYENVKSYYNFIKNCLQSIIILEAQLDVTESCLKSKRKHEKSSCTEYYNPPVLSTTSRNEEDYELSICTEKNNAISKQIAEAEKILDAGLETNTLIPKHVLNTRIVLYDSSSDDNSSDREEAVTNINNKLYFDDKENDLINEIAERKTLKRKSQEILNSSTKIFKLDTNRRKRRQPVKVETVTNDAGWNFNILEQIYEGIHENSFDHVKEEHIESNQVEFLPQVCLLCDSQFPGPPQLATHVFETHGIDMAQIVSAEPVMEKKKKIPNLVKITDLKQKRESLESKSLENGEEPPTLEATYVCPLCPASLTNKTDLFLHLRQKHPNRSSLICGLCLNMTTSYANLTDHLVNCVQTHPITQPFICKICKYNEDNQRNIENHVLVHDFVSSFCKKRGAIFDPGDYVELNPSCESTKTYPCNECGINFTIFKEFSSHRRSQHSIFHCDLCNKFYGRNSHLWKHVNRLHKGHPSITCQFCYKTSASKYHLSQHFNKIHTVKTGAKLKNGDVDDEDLSQKKFQRQEFIKKEDINIDTSQVPKEIDRSSDLYTNIITNYTPPENKGEFKCQKCSKGFHKKTLLKKHKKNCRPRLQKDLLTRCKTCSRIFKDRQSLAKHLVNYHSEYVCEICDEKVQSKCEIVSHIRFSHPSCHLFCKECSNVLRCQEDLELHSKDHSNSFVCQFCADLLPSRIKLKMHILSLHRKILNLSCGVCLKLFETQHILRDHVRLTHHDVLLPLTTCTVCGKNYGSKWKTYDHINKSHGRIFKACKACLEVFDTDLDLESHYYEVHGNTPKEKPIKKDIVLKKEAVIYESEEKNSSSADESSYDQDETITKMSLLEKRLTSQEDPPSKVIIKKENHKKLALSDSNYAPDQNGSNSSKRTVYVNSNDPSFCEICFKTWPAKKHLWQHYIRCHKLVAATVCGICLKTNDDYETLQKHLIENHPTLLHGKGFGSNFICRICGRYHNASSKLRLHMAIHENFDWRLFESIPIKQEINHLPNESINYENLIEQVECSSDDSSSSSDSDNEEEESDETIADINKPEVALKTDDESSTSQSVNVKSENCSSEDEDDEDDEDLSDDNVFSNNSDAGTKGMNLYRHPDIVNSAVESICYEDEEYDEEFNNHSEYMEVQNHNLNPHEIQSAVDSIL